MSSQDHLLIMFFTANFCKTSIILVQFRIKKTILILSIAKKAGVSFKINNVK